MPEPAIQATSQLASTVLERMSDAFVIWDRDWRYTYVNAAAGRGLGCRREDLLGRDMRPLFHPDPDDPFRVDYARAMADQVPVCFERWYPRLSFWVEVRAYPTAEGGLAVFFRDVSERKRAELRAQHLNRVYSVLSDINQSIVREKDPQAMLVAVCRIAVERGGFRMAWIGMVDPATRRLAPVASAGVIDGYLETLDIDLGDTRCDLGPTARALLTGGHQICNDIESDPRFAPWRKAALRRGYRSSAAFPLKVDGKAIGAFNIYSAEPGFFDDEELRLFDELSMDIGFALEVGRREANRRRTKEELQWKTAFLEAQVDSSFDGLLVVDDQGRKILQNRRFDELWQIPPRITADQDDAGQIRFAASRTKNPGEFTTKVAHLYAHPEETSRDEIELVDGTVMDRYSAPVRGRDGRYYGRIWSFRDVTERKRGEQRLADALHFNQTILAASPVGILAYTAAGVMVSANEAAAQLTGAPVERLFTQNFHHIDSWGLSGLLDAAKRALASGRAEFLESRFTTSFGKDVWLAFRFVPFQYAGTPHLLAMFSDVAERRQLEEQFRQSQKMESIGQLAGGIAHDFNNILAAMMMQIELITMDGNLPEEVRDGLRQIRTAAERAAGLTRQLLAFSRRQVMQPRALDLNEIVTSLVLMLQRILGEDVNLQLDLHPRPLGTLADPGMLDQVLLNLVVNARDAMPEGGRLVIGTGEHTFTDNDVAANRSGSAGCHVHLRVTDTGSGIPPDVLPRIFEPFFTTKEVGKGTGLGLATVFGIIKQHGGTLSVESDIGRGTSFHVFLPATELTAVAPAAAGRKSRPDGGRETILLVEDEPPVRLLTRVLLERNGYRVLEAADGAKALKLWEEHKGHIDLLFTDHVLPGGMSGRELAARLRSGHPGLRVVMTSGYSADIAGRSLSPQEGQDFIPKPCLPDQLLETIRRCLDR